jgi:fructokinase
VTTIYDAGTRFELECDVDRMKSKLPDKTKIVAMGEVLWDLFPDGDRFGGATANFACHAALLGADVTILSSVGRDPRGDEALQIMQRVGVDVSQVQRDPNAATGTVGVTVDLRGKPTFVIHPHSAWDRVAWKPHFEPILEQSDAFYFGTLGQRESISRATIERSLQVAKHHQLPRVLDINLRPPFFDDALIHQSVAAATILKLSDEEFHTVMTACGIPVLSNIETTLRNLLREFKLDLVAMTRGADGALLVTEDECIDEPGLQVDVIDTVGAGDAFTAALITGLCSGAELSLIASHACRVAANACRYAGAIPPSLKQI